VIYTNFTAGRRDFIFLIILKTQIGTPLLSTHVYIISSTTIIKSGRILPTPLPTQKPSTWVVYSFEIVSDSPMITGNVVWQLDRFTRVTYTHGSSSSGKTWVACRWNPIFNWNWKLRYMEAIHTQRTRTLILGWNW